jgi:hypothetical protein
MIHDTLIEHLEDRRLMSAGFFAGELRIGAVTSALHLTLTGSRALTGTIDSDRLGSINVSGRQSGSHVRFTFSGGIIVGHFGRGGALAGTITDAGARGTFRVLPEPKTRAGRQSSSLPRFDHVVIVMEENHGYGQILGPSIFPPTAFPDVLWPYVLRQPLPTESDPYIRSLADNGAVFTNSQAIAHPSQPNYLALFSGSTQGVTTDATPPHPFTAPNLGGELIAAGDTFTGYSEDLPKTGYAGEDVADYARRHSPWVDFTDVPPQDNQPFSRFPRFDQLPTVSFVIPNLQHDMHSNTIQDADRWLKKHVGAYANWAVSHNSLLIVTWDEDSGTPRNHIPTIFFGAHVRPGSYNEPVNHYSVLRTLEDVYGLPPMANAASAAPITDAFQ